MKKVFARYCNWRFARENEVIAKVGAVFLAHPERRHYGYWLSRCAGVRPTRAFRVLDQMLADGWVTDGWAPSAIDPSHPPRRYYRLTDTGLIALGMSVELDQQWKDMHR